MLAPPRQPVHARAAFTLLELLAAMFLAALVMAATLGVLAGAWRLQERAQEREQEDLPRQLAIQRLTGDLRAAVSPLGLLGGTFTAQAASQGDLRRDDVQWVAALGAPANGALGGDLAQVHYYLGSGSVAGEYQLLRTEQRNLLAVSVDSDTLPETVLFDHVVSFFTSWYDGSDWLDSWDSSLQENAIPEAGRVRLEFAANRGVTPVPVDLQVAFVARQWPSTSSSGGSGGTSP